MELRIRSSTAWGNQNVLVPPAALSSFTSDKSHGYLEGEQKHMRLLGIVQAGRYGGKTSPLNFELHFPFLSAPLEVMQGLIPSRGIGSR